MNHLRASRMACWFSMVPENSSSALPPETSPRPGKSRSLVLPFSSSSPWARLKADVRGDRAAFLLVETSPDETPAVSPRLVVAQIEP